MGFVQRCEGARIFQVELDTFNAGFGQIVIFHRLRSSLFFSIGNSKFCDGQMVSRSVDHQESEHGISSHMVLQFLCKIEDLQSRCSEFVLEPDEQS